MTLEEIERAIDQSEDRLEEAIKRADAQLAKHAKLSGEAEQAAAESYAKLMAACDAVAEYVAANEPVRPPPRSSHTNWGMLVGLGLMSAGHAYAEMLMRQACPGCAAHTCGNYGCSCPTNPLIANLYGSCRCCCCHC